jgi:5,10-methylene-tetrahydrofolate dehydrogenase/methenyl tetrahydrofolate cyclohydrolase
MFAESSVAERLLTSTALVESEIAVQRDLLGEMLVRPELAIVTTLGDNPAIHTYFRSKRRHADEVGVGFTDITLDDEDEALRIMRDFNEDELTHAIVMQLPVKNRARTQEMCDAVIAHKDVDALSRAGQEFFDPPTALAAVELARFHTNGFEGIVPHRVAVVGSLGRLVGAGAAILLQNEEFDPKLIDIQLGNEADIHTLGRDVDLIITATGQPGSITPRDLERPSDTELPLVIIDAGIGTGQDGKPAQDLHPDVFGLSYVRATKRTKAVGPLAVAFMFGNVIKAAQLQTHPN